MSSINLARHVHRVFPGMNMAEAMEAWCYLEDGHLEDGVIFFLLAIVRV